MIILSVISINAKQIAFSEVNDRDFLVWNDPIIETYDMQSLAKSAMAAQMSTPVDEEVPLQSTNAWWSIQMLWQNTENEYGILLKENLLALKQVEDQLVNHESYESFCKKDDSGTCDATAVMSPLSVFTGFDLEAATQAEIIAYFKGVAQTPQWDFFKAFFDNGVDVTADKPRVMYAQSFWNLGMPIEWNGKRYANDLDDPFGAMNDAKEGFVQPMFDWVDENFG